MSDDERIRQYLEPNPYRHGLADVAVKGAGVPVWALIGYLQAAKGDVARVAKDYALPPEAVEAAITFYRRHRAVIDARIAANAAEPADLLTAA